MLTSSPGPMVAIPGLGRAYCRMNRRVMFSSKVKGLRSGAAGKPSANSAIKLQGIDPKPGELSMARVKRG